MKVISNEIAIKVNYNPDTGDFVWVDPSKYHRQLVGCKAGAVKDGYLVIKINGVAYLAHRLAWFIMTGEQPNIIDHVNGNGVDNRFSNIRNCTQSDNTKNHGKITNGSGLPCGVRELSSGKYQARVKCDGKTYYLGTFKTAQEASMKYKAKRAFLFKQYNRI